MAGKELRKERNWGKRCEGKVPVEGQRSAMEGTAREGVERRRGKRSTRYRGGA